MGHLSGRFCLFPTNTLGRWWDIRTIFCQSVSVIGAVSTLVGGGGTQTLTTTMKLLELFEVGMLKHCSRAQ